jgi:hypothetical protein
MLFGERSTAMQSKANVKQTLWVLVIALVLVMLSAGGLWIYVQRADAATGVQEAYVTVAPEARNNISMEEYDNYPVASDYGSLFENGKMLLEVEIRHLSKLIQTYAEGLSPISSAPSLPGESRFAIVPLDPNELRA